ncbi:hypothetical protein NACSLCCMFF_290031 [Tenacibaculum maritimum]|nr:hypothetical protein NACSLCCMFF_290031 [Tenacibaculum maritimum]
MELLQLNLQERFLKLSNYIVMPILKNGFTFLKREYGQVNKTAVDTVFFKEMVSIFSYACKLVLFHPNFSFFSQRS